MGLQAHGTSNQLTAGLGCFFLRGRDRREEIPSYSRERWVRGSRRAPQGPGRRRHGAPRPLSQPARAAEGSGPSRPAAGATAPRPPGAARVRTAPDSRSGTALRGGRVATAADASPCPGRWRGESLPAGVGSRHGTQRSIPSPRPPSSPAAIATGSRGSRLSREVPSSRESRGPRRRRGAPPLARGLRGPGPARKGSVQSGWVWSGFSAAIPRSLGPGQRSPGVGALRRASGITRCPAPEGARGLRCV